MSDILGLYASPRLSHLKSRALGIEKKIKEYVMMDDSLSYEYIGKTRDFLFITGWNDIEKELPPFDHPMLIDGLMNKKYIAIDLRVIIAFQLRFVSIFHRYFIYFTYLLYFMFFNQIFQRHLFQLWQK